MIVLGLGVDIVKVDLLLIPKISKHHFLRDIENSFHEVTRTHPAKIDLNKKWLPKQKLTRNFNIDALGFRKTRNENHPMLEVGATS